MCKEWNETLKRLEGALKASAVSLIEHMGCPAKGTLRTSEYRIDFTHVGPSTSEDLPSDQQEVEDAPAH